MDAFCHQSDDRLELYTLGRLSDSDVEQVEEHLILCESCRERTDEIGNFAHAMKEDLTAHPVAAQREWRQRFEWLQPRFAMGFAMAGALAAVVLTLGIYWMGHNPRMASVASLQLTAMRGEMPTVAMARELDLLLTDATASGGPFRLDVVDANGAGVWTGRPEATSGGVGAKVMTTLKPGSYFARLFSASGQLLHEYGFEVRG